MLKCLRCGTVYEKQVKECEKCGYQFSKKELYYRKYYEGPKPEDMSDNQSDLVERPIFSFIFGILGLILPGTFIFSILAITIAPRPARSNLVYVQRFGKFLGYLGIVVSAVVVIIIVYLLIIGAFSR